MNVHCILPLAVLSLVLTPQGSIGQDISRNLEEVTRSLSEINRQLDSSAASTLDKTTTVAAEMVAPLTVYLSESRELLDCAADKVIYGYDNRINYYCADDREKAAVEATATLFKSERLTPGENPEEMKVAQIPSALCRPEVTGSLGLPEERFYDEPVSANCTGFKVGDRLIATAGHCVTSAAHCADTKIVFGYYKTSRDTNPSTVKSIDVYQCTNIVAGNYKPRSTEPDWRLLEVDRPIVGRPNVKVRAKGSPPPSTNAVVTMIGNPIGLPTKITRDGEIKSVSDTYFVTDLDSFGGNSGSPVYSRNALDSGELLAEGILVNGATDFVKVNACLISNVCSEVTLGGIACAGERATNTELLADFLVQ